MGLFSGRSAPPQRAMTLPVSWAQVAPGATITDYASVDANGENALRSIAIGSSINLICSLGSSLPVNVYRGYGSDRQQLPQVVILAALLARPPSQPGAPARPAVH